VRQHFYHRQSKNTLNFHIERKKKENLDIYFDQTEESTLNIRRNTNISEKAERDSDIRFYRMQYYLFIYFHKSNQNIVCIN
jgi:hypothetical protein